MIKANYITTNQDLHNLNRFISAQEKVYETVIKELKNGKKQTHWMWYIFPQIDGLGTSQTSKYYAIKSREEAQQYLNHPVLGKRLLECADIVIALEGKSISEIFDFPDDLKLKSSMTLFAHIAKPGSIFARIIDKYFEGKKDVTTLDILG